MARGRCLICDCSPQVRWHDFLPTYNTLLAPANHFDEAAKIIWLIDFISRIHSFRAHALLRRLGCRTVCRHPGAGKPAIGPAQLCQEEPPTSIDFRLKLLVRGSQVLGVGWVGTWHIQRLLGQLDKGQPFVMPRAVEVARGSFQPVLALRAAARLWPAPH